MASGGASPTTVEELEARLAHFFAQHYPEVQALFLFGSWVKGTAHRQSDVDLALVIDPTQFPTAQALWRLQEELMARLPGFAAGRPVDVVFLHQIPPLFARKILQEGRLLFCRDRQQLERFRLQALLRAADLEPFLRRQTGKLLSRLPL